MLEVDMIQVLVLRPGDSALLERVADGVFDHPIDPAAAEAHLQDPRLHLVVALDGGTVVGMASAVHYHHPDKPVPQLWIDELGVADSHRRLGIATRLLDAVFDLAGTLGCKEAWVLTEADNAAAQHLYARAGGKRSDALMFSFPVPEPL